MGPILTMRTPPSSKTVISAPATAHRLRWLLRPGLRLRRRRRFRCRLGAHGCFVGPLLGLVGLALRDGAYVGERRPVRCDRLPSHGTHAEVLPNDADHDPRLRRTEARKCCETLLELLGILRF